MTNNDYFITQEHRKQKSIAYFNAQNNATALVVALAKKTDTAATLVEAIANIREYMIAEYDKYHSEVIDRIGKTLTVADVLDRLTVCVTCLELIQVFSRVLESHPEIANAKPVMTFYKNRTAELKSAELPTMQI